MKTNYNDLKKILDKVYFIPWVGEHYEEAILFGKRIIVLGDSHNCDGCEICTKLFKPKEECWDFTKDVVEAYIKNRDRLPGEGQWRNTYLKFERSLVNRETNLEDRGKIWNSFVFYNYLQCAIETARNKRDKELYNAANEAFFQVLEYFQPEIVIVWGKQLWNNIARDNRWTDNDDFIIDNYDVKNGFYSLSNGKLVKTFAIYHPSAAYQWDFWHSVIEKMTK